MTDSVAIVILARLSSRRLPGKALKCIQGKETLLHILERLDTVVERRQVVLATSNERSDDDLEAFAQREGITCYRGSLNRVGERFYEAARSLGANYACRINGDNVFLAPEILRAMIGKAKSGSYNFLSNVMGRTFPKGMSVEIVKLEYYQARLPQIQADPYCNEHVMVCLYDQAEPDDHYYLRNHALPEAAAIQLALDSPDDWKRSQWLLEALPEGKYDLETTFEYYKKYEESTKR